MSGQQHDANAAKASTDIARPDRSSTGDLLQMVDEYLRFRGFHDSSDCLHAEMSAFKTSTRQGSKTKSSGSAQSQQVRERHRRQLLQAFDDGDWARFDTTWNRIVIQSYPPRSEQYTVTQRLRFKVAVHFAVYNLRNQATPGSKERQAVAMDKFKAFIQSEQLSSNALGANNPDSADQSSDLTLFYALPFVPNPRLHPGMSFVFDNNWPLNLKYELEAFLQVNTKSVSVLRRPTRGPRK